MRNHGGAAIVLGVLALAVAWPRLAPAPPELPPDEGIPLASPTPEVRKRSPARPKKAAERKPRAKKPAPRVTRRRAARERRPVERPRPVKTPEATAVPAPPAARRPTSRAPSFTPADPATTEFSFETGG
jgi:hypothetical protein